MKTILLLLCLLHCFLLAPATSAAMPVVDVGLIQTNLFNAKRDLAEQIIQGQRALEQIQHLRSQIEQVDDYLDRFGDPESITLEVFNEVVGFLKEIELAKTTTEIQEGMKEDEVFQTQDFSPYSEVSPNIVIDGEAVSQRDAKVFAPEVAARRAFAHYHSVQESVLQRRQELKAELERNLQQVKQATTSSEVQKLDIITRNLEAQLALVDRELQFASNEALIQFHRNQVEAQVQAKARLQEERARHRVAEQRNAQLYQLPNSPIYFKR